MQTLVLKVLVEWGWGLDRLARVVHSRLGEVEVPQMWAFVLYIVVPTKLMPRPASCGAGCA